MGSGPNNHSSNMNFISFTKEVKIRGDYLSQWQLKKVVSEDKSRDVNGDTKILWRPSSSPFGLDYKPIQESPEHGDKVCLFIL